MKNRLCRRVSLIPRALGALGILGLSACWSASTPSQPSEVVREDLIAGFAANDSSLDAVGSMSVMWTDVSTGQNYFDVVCSGVLIDDDTVLTAKHCIRAVSSVGDYGYRLVFALGPNAQSPARWIEVIDMETIPPDSGGFTGYGQDLGVLHLAEQASDVRPWRVASIEQAEVGKDFVGIGYGVQDNNYRQGTRRVGKLTLRARTGPTFEALFGSFAAFYEWYTGQRLPEDCDLDAGVVGAPIAGRAGRGVGVGIPFSDAGIAGQPARTAASESDCDYVAYIYSIYQSLRLEDSDQLVAGGAKGNAQPCYGDSGSPLARMDADGRTTVYGIVLGGVSSPQLICDRGGVFASFSAETLKFLDEATHWVDPCAGLTTTGQCDGTLARRCTNRLEGRRRVTEFDCAAIGLGCESQKDGSIGCGVDNSSFERAPEPARVGQAKPDFLSIERQVFIPPGAPLPTR